MPRQRKKTRSLTLTWPARSGDTFGIEGRSPICVPAFGTSIWALRRRVVARSHTQAWRTRTWCWASGDSSRRIRHSTWHAGPPSERSNSTRTSRTPIPRSLRCSKTTTGIGRWRSATTDMHSRSNQATPRHTSGTHSSWPFWDGYPEAVWHIEQARRADPVSPAINAYLPYDIFGRTPARASTSRGSRAVSLEPYSPLAHWQLGRAYLFSDQAQHAVAALNRAAALAASATMWDAEFCFAYTRAGDRGAAMTLLSALVDRAQHELCFAVDLAVAFSGIGDLDLGAGLPRAGG